MLASGLFLAGCGDKAVPAASLPVAGVFVGGAVADEPRAALIARDVLKNGGNAADAAVAAYFALAVTYPGAASLGGGGACVIYDPVRKRAEALEFLPRAAAAGGPVAVPGVVRGLGALHGRYGRSQWSALLAPAEQLARLGWPVTRAYTNAIEEAGISPAQASDLRSLATDAAGAPLREGQIVPQLDLAASIAALRIGGAAESSFMLAGFVASNAAIGGKVTAADVRATPLPWREPLRAAYGNEELLLTPTAAGEAAGRLWAAVPTESTFTGRATLTVGGLSDALAKVYDRAILPGAATGATTFAVVDGGGQAVACLATTGRPFGVRKVVPGTGILAATPAPGNITDALAAIAVNRTTAQSFATAGASGGGAAAAALVQTLSAALAEKVPTRTALERPRFFRNGHDAVLWHEAGLDEAFLRASSARGVRPSLVAGLARVSLIHCGGGLPRAPQTCRFEADPRAFGLGAATP